MGADLTILKTGRYFRDSYNNGNCWWLIGASYWGMSGQLPKDGDGNVTLAGAGMVLTMLERATVPTFKQWLETKVGKEEIAYAEAQDGPKLPAFEVRRAYDELVQKFEDSKEFWREAVREHSAVSWSV